MAARARKPKSAPAPAKSRIGTPETTSIAPTMITTAMTVPRACPGGGGGGPRPPPAPAGDETDAGRIGREGTFGGLRVRRLRVIDEAHPAHFADELEPVRHAGERPAALRDRRIADAGRPRGGGP